MKVAVYTIALNESAHVERWAASAADADYQIVADTGSTDGTVELLKQAGVSVYGITIRPWRFDDARNAALALIPSDADVCLKMDMDEYLGAGWRPKLEETWAAETTALRCSMVKKYAVEDSTASLTYSVKHFHHRWGYRFRRAVHETLTFTGNQEVTGERADIEIFHVQDHSKTTRTQYLPMMELAHGEDPNDSQLCFWLGREYMYVKQHEKAAETLKKYLALPSSNWPDERAEAMRYLARVSGCGKRMHWLHQACLEAPHRREIWLDLAEGLHDLRDWPNLFWACVNGITNTRRTGSYLDENQCWGYRLYDLGAIAAWQLHVYDHAKDWGEKALALGPAGQQLRLQGNLELYTTQRSSAGAG